MRIIKKRYIGLLIALTFFLIVAGCGGISKDLKVKALKVPEQLRVTEELIGKLKKEYERFKQTDQYQSEFVRYGGPDRENWDSSFDQAFDALAEAGRIYENEVAQILERNDGEEQPELKKQLKTISDKMVLGRQSAQKTGLRISRLQQAKNSMGEMLSEGEDKHGRIDGLFKDLLVFVRDGQKRYPEKKEDLDTRFSWFEKIHQESLAAFQVIKNEQASDTPDLALFADNHELLDKHSEAFTLRDQELRKKVSELDRSYSKILRDMKLEQKPWFEEVRYEWDNWSDWDTTKEVYRRKRYISINDYNALIKKGGEAGGVISRGNNYEVWIEDIDLDESYYHKYLFVEDEKQTPGDWEKVGEAFYDANEENLNMSILTKPVGMYEEEVITVAMPPGFDKVGDPRYGKWEENRDTGERQWSFFQRYLFWSMILNGSGFGRNYYSYDRYNDWNRNYRGRKPYYGRAGSDFGSGGRSTMTNSGMKTSTFARSGGFKTATPSVRGAGAGIRGRGPGAGK